MKKIIGFTGPSHFSGDVRSLVVDKMKCNYVFLDHDNIEDLEHWASMCSGLIFVGGIDLHPSTYGESVKSNECMSKFDRQRDLREFSLMSIALDNNIPFLGICRGHQLTSVYHSLRLVQDLGASSLIHQPSREKITTHPNEPMHSITLTDEGIELFGENLMNEMFKYKMPKKFKKRLSNLSPNLLLVNSFHHQGIAYGMLDRNKNELMVSPELVGAMKEYGIQILATGLGNEYQKNNVELIIEAMRGPNWITTQWHPEYDWQINPASLKVIEHFESLIRS